MSDKMLCGMFLSMKLTHKFILKPELKKVVL